MAEEAAKKTGQTTVSTEEQKDEKEDKGIKPNAGNGGETDKYVWEQSLKDVTVNVHLPQGLTSKQLAVKLTNTRAKVEIKGQPTPLIDAAFFKPIKVDDSLWTIESDSDGKRVLQLMLSKKEGQNWWDCVFEGDAKIDT